VAVIGYLWVFTAGVPLVPVLGPPAQIVCGGLGGGNREEEVQDRDGAQCAVEFQRCAAWVCAHEVSAVLNVRVFAAEVLLVPILGPSAHGIGGGHTDSNI
jgi:hypothetical protein